MKKIFIFLLFLLNTSLAFAMAKVVNIYTWGNFLPDEVAHQFTKETGIRVNIAEFDNNETMYAKLKATARTGYDIVTPSSYYVERLAKQGLIQRLDKNKLVGFNNLDPLLLNKNFDLNNIYSFPYSWGTGGIIINTNYFPKNSVTKWADLWKPQYKNELMVLDDVRETFTIGFILLGYSVNDTNPEHIKQVYLKLKELLPNIRIFNIDAVPNIYIDEDATIGTIWSGDARITEQENDHLQYILPEEGFSFWIDSISILSGAPHLENAYKFLNFILRPDIAKKISMITGYATPNLKARKLLPPEIRNNPTSYPDPKILKKGVFENDIDDKTMSLLAKYWEMLKIGE